MIFQSVMKRFSSGFYDVEFYLFIVKNPLLNFNFAPMDNLNPAKLIECASIEEIPSLLHSERRVVVIIDQTVKDLYGKYFPFEQITAEASEKNKSLQMAGEIAARLMDLEADRDTFILVVGGGILTDLGGFVASTYFRGLRCGYVPTTLLAQVDASLGGKNGVNLDGYKNILGVIRQPEFTVICPAFLKSLPLHEVNEGLSELLKTFILFSSDSYKGLVNSLMKARSGASDSMSMIAPYISEAARFKTQLTARDLYETGERKLLNLGHTFAHAIEKECGISHGEAVAAGIVLAAKLSVKLSVTGKTTAEKIENDFRLLGLRTASPVNTMTLADAIKRDKKRSGDIITFILIEKIGKCVTYPLPVNRLEEYLYDLY